VIDGGPLRGIVSVSMPAREVVAGQSRPATAKLVPYYAWNNRGEKSMIVWVPRDGGAAVKALAVLK